MAPWKRPSGRLSSRAKAISETANYAAAIRDRQHALVESADNGGVLLPSGQAFFATGRFDDEFVVTQRGRSSALAGQQIGRGDQELQLSCTVRTIRNIPTSCGYWRSEWRRANVCAHASVFARG